MAKKDSRYIRGPIGQGTPFKQVYKSDGTPDYPQAIRNQAKTSAEKASKKNGAPLPDNGKARGNDVIKHRPDVASKLEKQFGRIPEPQHFNNLGKSQAGQKNSPSVQQGKNVNITKDEPEIDK